MKDGRIKPKADGLSGRERLARWIVRGRMTQGEAADQIGISRVKLNQYLQGAAKPSIETAIRIEDASGIGVRAWLVDDVAAETGAAAGVGTGIAEAGSHGE